MSGSDRLTTADLAEAAKARENREPEADEREMTRTPSETMATSEQQPAALFPSEENQRLHNRWMEIQGGFVDEPRRSVQQADELVANVVERLVEVFAREHAQLEQAWSRGDDVSTEDLRVTLRRYRAFFDRLLAV